MPVGENVITFKDTGFCPVPVIDRDQVTVQKGDMIGMRIDGIASCWRVHSGQTGCRLVSALMVMAGRHAVGCCRFEYHTSDDPTDPNAHGGHLCRYCTHEYLESATASTSRRPCNHLRITLLCHRPVHPRHRAGARSDTHATRRSGRG